MRDDPTPLSARLGACLADLGLAPVPRRGGGWSVEVPSISRGAVGVGLRAHERTVRMGAFVMRAPDRRRTAVYRRLLERNLQMVYWRFGLDPDGDVVIAAHLDAAQLSAAALDGVLGLLVGYIDETYEGLVRTGFAIPPGVRIGGPPPIPAPPGESD